MQNIVKCYIRSDSNMFISQKTAKIFLDTSQCAPSLTKNKLQSQILNDKKSLYTKIFFSVITKNSNWEMLTMKRLKNFNIFKVHWNIQFNGRGRTWQKRGGVIPQCTLCTLYIFMLTNHIFAEQYILVNCFIIEFIVFYRKVEIYLSLKLTKENQLCLYFLFLDIYLQVR